MGAGDVGSQACGNRIRLVHNDPGVDKALELGFNRLVLERSVDNGLSYSEVNAVSSRPVLEADLSDYVLYDLIGDPQYLYRTRYGMEGSTELSTPSDAIAGAGAAIQSILTVDQLKQRYLFGVDTTDDAGQELPDKVYEHYILAAIARVEHTLDIKVLPTTILNEMHDYYRRDYQEFNFIQLENYPLISVEEFNVQYPSGQTVVNFPLEWVREDLTHGILRIVPTAGTLSEILIGQGGSFLPAIYNGMSHLPDLFALSYTAGFTTVPSNILDIIGKIASMGPFNIFGDLVVGAGIANISVGIDGLSQTIGSTASATSAGYGARLIQYGKEIKADLPGLIKYYKGIRMSVM